MKTETKVRQNRDTMGGVCSFRPFLILILLLLLIAKPNATERNRTISGSPFPRFAPVRSVVRVFAPLLFVQAESNKTERFHKSFDFDHAVPTTYDDAFTSRSIFSEGKVAKNDQK
jgi:hypothetical protein